MQAGIAREHDVHHKIAVFKQTFSTELLAAESAPREDNYKEKRNIAPASEGKWGEKRAKRGIG